jgi:hypothetical protein
MVSGAGGFPSICKFEQILPFKHPGMILVRQGLSMQAPGLRHQVGVLVSAWMPEHPATELLVG